MLAPAQKHAGDTPWTPPPASGTDYVRYHRDPRNIATHFVGIPLIAFGIAALLARVPLGASGAVLPGAHWLVWG